MAFVDGSLQQLDGIVHGDLAVNDQGRHLDMQRHDRPQIGHRLTGPAAHAVIGLEQHVTLQDGELELIGLEHPRIVDRACRRFDRATETVLGAIAIDDAAQATADRVVDAAVRAGADRYERVAEPMRWRRHGKQHEQRHEDHCLQPEKTRAQTAKLARSSSLITNS